MSDIEVYNLGTEDSSGLETTNLPKESSASTSGYSSADNSSPSGDTSMSPERVRSIISDYLQNYDGTFRVGSTLSNEAFIVDTDGIRLGGTEPTTATFRVQKDGTLTATSVTVTGEINATSGAITGILTVGDTGGTHIIIDGTNGLVKSSNFSAGSQGWQMDHYGNAEFENVVARGVLKTTVFEKDTVSAVGGQLMVVNADALDADMTALDSSTLTITGETTFAANDILLIKDGTDAEYLRVTSAASAPTYSVTRDLAGSYAADTNPAWKAGTAVVQQGSSDGASTYSGGYLRLIGSGSNSPRYSVFKRTGVAYNAVTEYVGIGNVNGLLDYSSDEYGIAIGTTALGWMSFDQTNGLRVNGGLNSEVSLTSGEALAAGDTISVTSSNTVKRYAPTALPPSFDQSADSTSTFAYTNSCRPGIMLPLSTSLFAFACRTTGDNGPGIVRVPITPESGAVGTLEADATVLAPTSNMNALSLVAAGTNKVLITASTSGNEVKAAVSDLSSTISTGTVVTVDSSNVSGGFGEYISDSHVLFISQDTSSGNIQFAKYTLSGTTLTSSSTGTVTTTFAGDTYVILGVRQFGTSAYFLIITQNTTDATAYALVAHYDTGSSTFDSVGSPVSFSSVSSAQADNAVFASLSSTQMIVYVPTSTTAGVYFLVTRSDVTPTVGTLNSATARGANASYTLTPVNSRCAYLCTTSGTTATVALLELNAAGTDVSARVSASYTQAPSTGSTIESGGPVAAFRASSTRMGFYAVDGAADDPEVGTGTLTLPPYTAVAKAAVAAAASVTGLVSGVTTDVTGLTAGSRTYAEIGGLVSHDGNGNPDKVGIAAAAAKLILRSW